MSVTMPVSAPTVVTPAELRRQIARLPRVVLGHFPTALEPMPRFSAALGGPPIWIKRDDCTGLALGGNKTRHNEFIFGHAVEQGAEMFVWGAGVQSNNCRQTAAACAKLGLPCHLILTRDGFKEDIQGNLLLDHIFGATVQIVDAPMGPQLDDLMTAEAARQRAAGKKVYVWDRDICKPRAAVSYVECMVEIAEQLAEREMEASAVYVCSAGSTGTGMLLGKAALGLNCRLRLIAPISWPWHMPTDLAHQANVTAQLLGLGTRLVPEQVDVTDAYLAPGYGKFNSQCMEAIRLLARTEGILLDPIYTGKALAALMDDVRQGRLPPDKPVVFVHTGGTPALFAYRDEIMRLLPE